MGSLSGLALVTTTVIVAQPLGAQTRDVMGWSPEQAAAYMAEGRLVPPGTEMELMVMRSAVWPGQLTAYDTGALEIRALREEAERALGPRFD